MHGVRWFVLRHILYTCTILSFFTSFDHLTGEKTEVNFDRILAKGARYDHTLSMNNITMAIRISTERMQVLKKNEDVNSTFQTYFPQLKSSYSESRANFRVNLPMAARYDYSKSRNALLKL